MSKKELMSNPSPTPSILSPPLQPLQPQSAPLPSSSSNASSSNSKEEVDMCPICQEMMEDKNKIKTLECKHKFHNECINVWINMRNLCPLCNVQADKHKEVKELKSDDDLSLQLINSLLTNAINQSAVNFWRSYNFDMVDMVDLSSMLNNTNQFFFHFQTPTLMSQIPQIQRRNTTIPQSQRRPSHLNLHQNPYQNRNSPQDSKHFQPSQPFHDSKKCEKLAQCTNCFEISCEHVMKRCSGCHQSRYCSSECQLEHWPDHKDWCKYHRL
jgi:hypothetical protein